MSASGSGKRWLVAAAANWHVVTVRLVLAVVLPAILSEAQAAPDIVLADFEGADYGQWTATGNCFGKAPARGTLQEQNPVHGFLGKGLINTFLDRDRARGTLLSPEFEVTRDYINFLIGGGMYPNDCFIELVVDGEQARVATGKSEEELKWYTWDVKASKGRRARIRIVDRSTRGWGHINVDQITLSDAARTTPRGDPETERRQREAEVAAAREVLHKHGVDELIFAVRRVDTDGHWYANFSTNSGNPNRKYYHDGARLCRLDLRTGEVRAILEDSKGGIRDPQMHYSGEKILFSYRKGGQPYYHLHEIRPDGTGLRQLTDGPFDDVEPTYVPDGGIVFCSTRCKRFVNCWFTRVAVLHRCEGDGNRVRALSSNVEHDNTPWVLPDGRILHQRWEYIDRAQTWYHHLWTMFPDGTNQMVYYGNLHAGTVMIDAKPIPGTRRVVASFSPGHGQNEHAGYITIVDPGKGPDNRPSARRVAGSRMLYRDPYPLAEDCILVADDFSIFLLDDKNPPRLVYEMPRSWRHEDGRTKLHEPRPLRGRPMEVFVPPRAQPDAGTGTVFLQDVTRGRNMDGVKPGEITELLVVEALPKPVNFSGGWEPVSFGGTFTLERVLGTVPVQKDGSAFMELPALRSLFFVALDRNGRSVKRMQSFLTIQPGESFGCVGCHEERVGAPAPTARPLAMARAPSKIKLFAGMPDVFDFPRDIQPILDRHCVACHGYERTVRGGPRSGGVILTGDRGPWYSHSYFTLSLRKQFTDGRNAGGNLPPRAVGSGNSPILDKLAGSHHGVRATDREQTMVRLWIDSAAAYPGTYAALGTGMVGRSGRVKGWGKATDAAIRKRCAACHSGKSALAMSPGHDLCGVGLGGSRIRHDDPRFRFSRHIVYNLSRPEKSLLLLAPLHTDAGGYAGQGKGRHKVIFADSADPDYMTLLKAIKASKAELEGIKRFDMAGFRPNTHYIREMTFYDILPDNLPDDLPIDVYATDQAYWRSLWYHPTN